MSKTLVVIPDKCTGCGTCKLACSMIKGGGGQQPVNIGRTRIHIYPTGQDRYMQMTCMQCADAACIRACDVAALIRNVQTGAIEVHEDRCIGCGLCETACPFGHLHFELSTGLPEKCDLCGGDPTCARFCPHGALVVD